MGAKDFLAGTLVGAGLVYYLDPERGPDRRTRLRERLGVGERAGPARYGSRLGDIHGLEAANLGAHGSRRVLGHLARIAGGAMVAYGLLRRGTAGGLFRRVGMGLAAVGVGGSAMPSPTPGAERRRTVDIQKTLYVTAPVERVYAFWSNYENFPQFLSSVRDVEDLGGGRSRWVVNGPGSSTIEWISVLTDREADRLLAWRSEPGAVLEHAGVVRVAPEGGGTRVDLRFCYNPPGGRAGRALGEFFGADPRARVNEDLARLKALLESTVRSDSHDQEHGS